MTLAKQGNDDPVKERLGGQAVIFGSGTVPARDKPEFEQEMASFLL
ncbi:hypothetical protein [Sphingobium vermicomposti]|uniref:Uncharacterized protein n=1 Tax=Sphingobium vermicomposti TaxID=529005 RepID=A0A846M0Q4_9SPHN|nr:hypothetical protein [Sphingobium vermicomposti]NIJ15233.1 hypothetical protein [Sphingobium vermicomposti]